MSLSCDLSWYKITWWWWNGSFHFRAAFFFFTLEFPLFFFILPFSFIVDPHLCQVNQSFLWLCQPLTFLSDRRRGLPVHVCALASAAFVLRTILSWLVGWVCCFRAPGYMLRYNGSHRRKRGGKVTGSHWLVRSGLARPQTCCFLHQAVSGTGRRTHLEQTGVHCLWLHHVPGMTLSRVLKLLCFASIHKTGGVPCHPAEQFPFLLISTLDRGFPRVVINSGRTTLGSQIKLFF